MPSGFPWGAQGGWEAGALAPGRSAAARAEFRRALKLHAASAAELLLRDEGRAAIGAELSPRLGDAALATGDLGAARREGRSRRRGRLHGSDPGGHDVAHADP